jgi:hypothetical protein
MRGLILLGSAVAIAFTVWFYSMLYTAVQSMPLNTFNTTQASLNLQAAAPGAILLNPTNERSPQMVLGRYTIPANAYPPTRFIKHRNITTVAFATPEGIALACGGAVGEIIACASVDAGDGNWIAAPHPCQFPNDPYAVVLCHELGHNNGWRHEA